MRTYELQQYTSEDGPDAWQVKHTGTVVDNDPYPNTQRLLTDAIGYDTKTVGYQEVAVGAAVHAGLWRVILIEDGAPYSVREYTVDGFYVLDVQAVTSKEPA